MITLRELELSKPRYNVWEVGDFGVDLPINNLNGLAKILEGIVDLQLAVREFNGRGFSVNYCKTGRNQIEVKIHGFSNYARVVFKNVNDEGCITILKIAEVLGIPYNH